MKDRVRKADGGKRYSVRGQQHAALRRAPGRMLASVLVLALAAVGCQNSAPPRRAPAHLTQATYYPSGTTLTPDADTFQFAIVADRTGGHRPGVFEQSLAKLNLLRPDFVMSVGDLIEGYTTDPAEIARQWDEFVGFVETLEVPFHYVAGNHDISNTTMDALWRERFGSPVNHFVHRDVLFLTLNTQGGESGYIDDVQIASIQHALAENADVRWTLVFMHQPIWSYRKATQWERVEALLQDRPYTVFAGHMHRYLHEQRHGRDYFVLGTSGGASSLRGVNYGEVDHVTWVTMTDAGPRVANLLLDGIWDEAIFTPALEEKLTQQLGFTLDAEQKLQTEGDSFAVPPIFTRGEDFTRGQGTILLRNPSDHPLRVEVSVAERADLRVWPGSFRRELAPHAETSVTLEVWTPQPTHTQALAPLPVTARFSMPLSGRPPLEFERHRALLVLDEAHQADAWETFGIEDGLFGAESLLESRLAAEAGEALAVLLPRVSNAPEVHRAAQLALRIDPLAEPAAAMGFVTTWEASGPFAWSSEQGLPELLETTQPEQVEPGLGSGAAAWRRAHTTDAMGKLDLLEVYGPREEVSAFVRTTIEVPQAVEARLGVGSDDGVRIWLNGHIVHRQHAFRGVTVDQDNVPVRLQQGANSLVVQVTQSREGWGLALRVTDLAGRALKAAKTYPSL